MPAHTNCPFCGTAVSSDARYCDRCGTPLTAEAGLKGQRRVWTGRLLWAALFLLIGALLTAGVLFFRHKPEPPVITPPDSTSVEPPVDSTPKTDSKLIARYLRSVVSISVRGDRGIRTGSGFLIDRNGHVVTAAHLIEGAHGCVSVTDDNGREHPGTIVAFDANRDVALVSVPDLAFWPEQLVLGESKKLRVGDEIYVFGSPKGIGNPVSLSGSVMRLGDETTIDSRYYGNLLQLGGTTVIEGTSGGPLVAKDTGLVVGVVTAGSNAPVAWAVPSDDFADQMKQWVNLPVRDVCTAVPMTRTVPLTLATITPLSGAYGVEGSDLADGAELALRDMEGALKSVGYEVTIRRQDDQDSPTAGRDRAGTVAQDPKVIGVMGSFNGPTTQAIADRLMGLGLPVVTPTAGSNDLTARGWQFFDRLVASEQRQEQAAARFAKDTLKARSVFLLDDGTAEAARQSSSFEMAAQVISLPVAGRAQFASGTKYSDLRRQIVDAKAESIYVAGGAEPALKVIQGLRREGLILPVLGNQSLFDPRFESFKGMGADSIYFTRLTAEPSEQFKRHFESVLGRPSRGYAAYGYDAAAVMLSALLHYGQEHPAIAPSRADLARLVRETKGHPGWSSLVTFDSSGENLSSWVYVFEWKQGVAERREHLK